MAAFVLVPAAGAGRRMGAKINKQYLTLAGRPILAHTLQIFQNHPSVDGIVVVSPREEMVYCRAEVVERYSLTKVVEIVEGGEERQDSVRNGLSAIQGDDSDIVLVHDGVRPFFPSALVDAVIESAARVGGCVVGVPVKDTIKEVDGGLISGTPPRGRLWQAQTPQAFSLATIRSAYKAALRDGFRGTDDASLVERLGLPVAMIEGSYRNIKITTPEDLVLARAFLDEGVAP